MSTHQGTTSSRLMWWAYIHAYDRCIKLKRWMPPIGNQLDDLQYCRKFEMGPGTFVYATTLEPFAAENPTHAMRVAIELFRKQGFVIDEVATEKHCSGRANEGRNRFYLLDLE